MKLRNVLQRLKKGLSLRNDITRKILFTIAMVVVYRLLAMIPLPGVDPKAFNQVFTDTPFNNIFTAISGGRLDQPSLVAIGVAPYINASIVIQLLTTVIPKLEDLSKQGELGRQKINQITRILTLPLAILQSVMIYTILTNPSAGSAISSNVNIMKHLSGIELITFILTLTAGSMVLMWIGELITEHGIGNGASVIIALGIIASLPSLVIGQIQGLAADWQNVVAGSLKSLTSESFVLFYVVIAIIVVMIFLIVFINEAVRKIPVFYAKRYRGDLSLQSFLPVRLNQAGVMPVIFAQSLMTFPIIIANFILSSRTAGRLYDLAVSIQTSDLLKYNTVSYIVLFFFLIIGFSYFYTFVVAKPEEIAKNLQKSGAFVPAIRPGNDTIKYIVNMTLKLTFFGAIFLAVISIIPKALIFFESTSRLTILSGIGGTSLLIVVGVFMDSKRKLESLKSVEGYETYK